MRSPWPILALYFVMASGPARAEWWPAEPGADDVVTVEIVHRGPDHLDLLLTLSGVEVGSPDERGYAAVEIPGEGTLGRVGEPAVPTVSRWIAAPAGSHAWAEVLREDTFQVPCAPVAPRQPPGYRSGPRPAFTVAPAVYRSSSPVPATAVAVGAVAQVRRQGLVRVELRPVRYLPRDGELEVARTLEVRIHLDGGEAPPAADVPCFDRLLDRWVMGMSADRDAAPPVPEAMLVIVGDELADAVEPLVEWKSRRGVAVTVLTSGQVGMEPSDVRRAISDAYAASDPPLTYVLLVGDETHVPVQQISASDHDGQGESDFLYTLIDGDDTLPDVLIGRFSARTADQAAVMVDRVVRYERDVGRTGPDGFTEGGTGIASSGIGSFDPDYVRMERVVTALEDYGYARTDRFYEGQWSDPQDIVAAVEQGRGWICFMGHGSGTSWHFDQDPNFSFGVGEIAQIDNDGHWPVVVDVACNNGDFTHHEPCFAEAWTRAGTPTRPLGAVGIYSSTISAAWDEPAEMEEGVVYSFLDDREAVWGEALVGGLLHMEAFFGNSATVEEVKRTFLNFGDPSLLVRSKVPTPLVVEHDHAIAPGLSELRVEVLDDDDGPVADAVVALSSASVLRAVALTDEDGEASFDLDLAEGEVLDVVVTGFDLVTYEGIVVAMDVLEGDDDDHGGDDELLPGDADAGPTVEIGSGCQCNGTTHGVRNAWVLAVVAAAAVRRRSSRRGGQR